MIDIKKYTDSKDFFNLNMLILTAENVRMLKEVKKPNIFEPNTQMFDREGLFSTDIFGPIGSSMRMYMPGYIDLGLNVLHGAVFEKIMEMGTLYRGIISGEIKAIFDNSISNFIQVSEDDPKGKTGYSFFINNINKVKTEDSLSGSKESRYSLIELGTTPDKMLNKFIVIPAGLRDYVVDESGKASEDEINGLYRKILSIVSMVKNTTLDESNIELLDPLRYKLQLATYEVYNYISELIGKGKEKFIQGKWAKRAVMFGTRNVITGNPIYVTDLNSDNQIGFNDTVIGLYQFIKSITPIAANKVLSIFISKFINPSSDTAMLVNPKTMKTELVEIPIKRRDEWLSLDGINNMFNKFGQDSNKGLPVKIDDYYLMLVYDDGKTIKYYFNTDEIEDDINKKFLRPITYIEMLYMAIYDVRHKYPAFLTRYPVAALGGIYPSYLYVKTTIIGRTVELTMDGITKTVYEYPKLGEEYMNSLSVHNQHLQRLGADFDGDTMSENTLTSKEAIQEIDRILNSKEYYITPDGVATYSVTTPTLEFTLAHMSDTVNILKVVNYNDVVNVIEHSKLIELLTNIYKGTFNNKITNEEVSTWLDKLINVKKHNLLLCVNGKNKPFGFVRYRITAKDSSDTPYGMLSSTDKYMYISDLASIKKGSGTKLTTRVLELADENKVDTILVAGNDKLVSYYERFGFSIIDGKTAGIDNNKIIMIRRSK